MGCGLHWSGNVAPLTMPGGAAQLVSVHRWTPAVKKTEQKEAERRWAIDRSGMGRAPLRARGL